MASAHEVVEGLQILLRYDPDVEVVVEHDTIFAGHGLGDVSAPDSLRLDDLGWHWDADVPAWTKEAA